MSPLHCHPGRVARSLILAVALGGLLPGIGTANQGVYKRGMLSVVWIVHFPPESKTSDWVGSGFLVNEHEKIVVTNCHVVGLEGRLVVFVPNYQGNELVTDPMEYAKNAKLWVEGKVVARSPSQDLALIRLATLPRGLREIPLAKRGPKPGETLHAIGNSGTSSGTLWRYSKGTVREVNRMVRKFPPLQKGAPLQEVNVKWVATQIPTNQGDSGGPVLNERGELAAVVQGAHPKQTLVTYTIDVSELRVLLEKQKLLPKRKSASSTKKGRD